MDQPKGTPPRASAARQLRMAGLLVVIVAAIVGGAYGVYWVTVGRPLLHGAHEHDFGIVTIVGPDTTLTHRFVLTNETGRTITIRDVKTTCRCTVAEISDRTIEAGQKVQIEAALAMRDDGVKTARVHLDCGDDGVETLRLRATGRRAKLLTIPAGQVFVDPRRPVTRTMLYFEYEGSKPPPNVRFTLPEAVQATFDGWKLVSARRNERAARWHGGMTLRMRGQSLPPGSTIRVQVGQQQVEAPLLLGHPPPEPDLEPPPPATSPDEPLPAEPRFPSAPGDGSFPAPAKVPHSG